MGRASPAVVSGPLAAYAEGFHAALVGQGYTLNSAGFQLWLMAHLSRWLTSQGLGPSELSTATLERFLEARRDAGYMQWLSMRAMAPLLGYLRQVGVVAAPEPPPAATPVDRLLERYRDYLASERGLAASTIRSYLDVARLFLAGRVESGELDLKDLTASEVSGFVRAEAPRRSVGSAKY